MVGAAMKIALTIVVLALVYERGRRTGPGRPWTPAEWAKVHEAFDAERARLVRDKRQPGWTMLGGT